MNGVGIFQVPTRVHFGAGVAAVLPDHLTELGVRRPLVVSDPGVVATGIVDRLVAPLAAAGLTVTRFDGVSGNPRDHECLAGEAVAREARVDGVIAIGGGSPMDAAKTIAALVTNGGTVQDWETPRALAHAPLPMIAIPTTAGTGSEVTFYAVVTDTTRAYKMSLFDTRLAPRVALVDPDLTLSVPSHITAATGIDTLTHAIEAYTGRLANPITDGLALQAIRLVARHLVTATRDGNDRGARAGMMMASLIAGMAFGNTDVAAVHCLAEAIGGRYDTPHGVANAVFLPHVFAHNAETAPERHAEVAEALGVETAGQTALDAALLGAAAVQRLTADVGIPRLATLPRVDPADFAALADAAARNVSNPSNCRPLSQDDYVRLLWQAWDTA